MPKGKGRKYTAPIPFASSGNALSKRYNPRKQQKLQDESVKKQKIDLSDIYQDEKDLVLDDKQRKIEARAYDSDAQNSEDEKILDFNSQDDEEISEDDAFDQQDKEKYGAFFSNDEDDNESDAPSDFEDDEDAVDLSQIISEAESEDDKPAQTVNLQVNQSESDSEQFDSELLSDSDFDGDLDDFSGKLLNKLNNASDKNVKSKGKSKTVITEAFDENEFGVQLKSEKKLTLKSLLDGEESAGDSEDDASQNRSSKILAAPLPALQQQQIQRSVAYKETSKEISKWTPIIQKNRKSEQLQFPLVGSLGGSDDKLGLSTKSMVADYAPVKPANDLPEDEDDFESSITKILNKSKIANEKQIQEKEQQLPMNMKGLSKEELLKNQQELQKMKALLFYSEIKMKRAAKNKSKKFKRLLKKEKKREDAKLKAELDVDNSYIDDDVEDQERQRAEERVSLRHRISHQKFDFKGESEIDREKMIEKMQKHQQLMRKIEGRSDSENEEIQDKSNQELIQDLQQEIKDINENNNVSGVFAMKFMKDAMKNQRKRTIEDLQEEDIVPVSQSGRMKFTASNTEKKDQKAKVQVDELNNEEYFQDDQDDFEENQVIQISGKVSPKLTSQIIDEQSSQKVFDIKVKERSDLTSNDHSQFDVQEAFESAQSDEDENQITFSTQRDIIKMAFANDDVFDEDFENEKDQIIREDAPQQLDQTLPGWGSWSGAGIKKKPKKKFVVNIEGISPDQRKDKDLRRVILNEKKDKKFASKYLTDQIPFPYKSREQYEASLKLPLGREWNTTSVHKKLIQPRISVKPGKIIQPLKYTTQPKD